MIAALRRPSARSWLPLALVGVALLLGIGAVILLAQRSGRSDLPPEPSAFVAPAPARPVVALDVQQSAGGRLTLSDGSRDQALKADARVERLSAIEAAQLRPGDWLTVIGIPNEIRNFSIRSIVVLSSPAPPDADGVRRSAGGFAGHEASRDGSERPLLGGLVERVDGERVTLAGPTGPVTVTLGPRAPLYRIEPAPPGSVREGDRIAFVSAPSLDAATAILVLPGGAR
jgi:hypothetical protein